MNARKVRYHAVLALGAVAGLAGTGLGQDALGDGRGLQAQLQVQAGPRAPSRRRTFSNELAFREAIVSGTAPAGLSFQGEALPSRFEFRGELAEDDMFAFRRDSLYSGLSGQGIRGTDALQYQFALTVGGRVPTSLAGQLSYARAGDAERGSDPDRPLVRDLTLANGSLYRVIDADLMVSAVEAGSSLVQPVRSVSTFTANRGMQPTLIGLMQNRSTRAAAGQTASPLLGVQVLPVERLRDATALPNLYAPGADPAQPEQTSPSETGKPAYDLLIDRFRDASPLGEGAESQLPLWARDLVSLQQVLRGIGPARAAPIEEDPTGFGALGETEEAPAPASGLGTPVFDHDVLRRVREAGGLSDTLVPVDIPQIDRYVAYMQNGQAMLAEGRYFDAEESFIGALTFRSADVSASIGRAHAQIGAGLFLSAGLNIRQLLVHHPETAGMRYGAGLLPAAGRLGVVTAALRSSLGSPTAGADSGLLLAYLGFQRGIQEDLRDGLGALEAMGDDADRRLAEMLRVVWLDAGEGAGEDSPADGG